MHSALTFLRVYTDYYALEDNVQLKERVGVDTIKDKTHSALFIQDVWI